jgi:DedD protein
MAFFKFRKAADDPAKTPPQPQSIESMRQRAKHRLAGATVLVVIGIIAFPMLFDKQPRPIAVDTPIDIPDRNKVPPLVLPAASTPKELPVLPASAVAPVASKSEVAKLVQPVASKPEVITEVADKKVPAALVKPEISASKNKASQASAPAKPVASAPVKPVEVAKPVLEAKPVDAASAQTGRYILQVGAFADAKRAYEVRLKLEHAGLKTYTHVAETPDGKRIRVRVGPFTVKADAEKNAVKIKKLDLPAALLKL